MFPNIFASKMAVMKQVTSKLQAMKQWNLYFSFLTVFTEQQSFNSLSTLFRMGGGRSAKRLLTSFPQHFWLLVLLFFPHSCKISGSFLVPSQIIVLEPRPPLKIIGFSGQTRIDFSYDNFFHKNAKLTKIWSNDHIYYII